MRRVIGATLRLTTSRAARVSPCIRDPASLTPLRAMSATTRREDPFKPAARVAGQKQDVWYANCERRQLYVRHGMADEATGRL